MAKNLVYHSRTKHIEIDIHFIRNKVLNKELSIQYISSADQAADIMTKPLSFIQFNYLRAKLNVHSCPLSLRGAVREAHCAEKRKLPKLRKTSKLVTSDECKQNDSSAATSAQVVKSLL